MFIDLIWLVPVLPGVGAALNGLFGICYFSKRQAAIVACTTMAGSLVLSVAAFAQLLLGPEERFHQVVIADWIPAIPLAMSDGSVGSFEVPWAFTLDPLAGMMLLIVTGIGFLIHVYSVAYMDREPRPAYAPLLLLPQPFLLFHADVGVGEHIPRDVRRVGGGRTLVLSPNRVLVPQTERHRCWQESIHRQPGGRLGLPTRDLPCLLYLRDARFSPGGGGRAWEACRGRIWGPVGDLSTPVHWRHREECPDSAVRLASRRHGGSTPVSALIHAATMVTAGVYMVARNAVLFEHAPTVMMIIVVTGALTALIAATIGLVQTDIKRVLAYSTVSQLGYMFIATGVGAFGAATFHLMTHAFFKALLFLGSGSVIHSMNDEQDMRQMGGMKLHMPITFVTMVVGALAIAGVPPLSRFLQQGRNPLSRLLAQQAALGPRGRHGGVDGVLHVPADRDDLLRGLPWPVVGTCQRGG